MSATGTRRSASPTSSSPRNAEKRPKACAYCFRRKMKCDLAVPCSNCIDKGEECVPAARKERPRPTHEKIDKLEAEILRLETLLNQAQSQVASAGVTFDGNGPWTSRAPRVPDENGAGPSGTTQHTAISPSDSVRSRLRFGQYGHQSAHGPTSAFFDDLPEQDQVLDDSPRTSGLDEATEKRYQSQATAMAASERHNEVLNLAAGRLELDGVAPDLAMHLLGLHWNRQHYGFMVSYRPLFTRDMACNGPYFSKLLLNAMFFSVSKFSDRPEVYDDPLDQTTAGQRFLRRVKALLGEALDRSSIPTIQAMLLLSSSLFALGEQSAAWVYSGIAIRMIIDLGLNYPNNGNLPAAEIEIRRRIVWAAFIYDKIISLYQGRAVTLGGAQMHVAHRFYDMFEEQEQWTPYAFPGVHQYPGSPACAISTFTAYCSLAVIMDQVITHIYAETSVPEGPRVHLNRLSASLDRWRSALPAAINHDPTSEAPAPPPHVLSLHMVYWTLVTLLHRPFVESGHLYLADPPQTSTCWARCEAAANGATSLLSQYRRTFSLARAPYLISYSTYVASTIHVRIAAQRGPQSEASRLLGVCLEALQENGATNPGVQKMLGMIQVLMQRMGVSLEAAETVTNAQDVPFGFGLDLDAIVRSFHANRSDEVDFTQGNGLNQGDAPIPGPAGPFLFDNSLDSLYGFLNFQ